MNFTENWTGKGSEKSDTQKFWLELIRDVLGYQYPEDIIDFEDPVQLEHKSFIDAYIPSTKIIIEQKSFDIDLSKSQTQSDGTALTPFQQAKRYYDWLPVSKRGRYILVCNFQELRIHDMETPKAPPEILALNDFTHDNLAFLVNPEETLPHEVALSIRAGRLVGKLYDALRERYINPDDEASQRSLNVFCVRLVFLLYAEDSNLFKKSQFHDYLKPRALTARDAMRKLFDVLSQQEEQRDPYLEADLKAFPYVNGGLFEEKNIELPQLDGEPLRIILEDMSEGFDWSGISPTIFGAVFESTINEKIRHKEGMHYTAIENIHKVIDPMFMEELTEKAEAVLGMKSSAEKTKQLRKFQNELAELTFFDPACGSGNFLTETYLSLRRLENRIIAELSGPQITFAFSESETAIKISILQFYGIEINDFAASVAKTALWIAEAKMWNETRSITQYCGELLPLKTYDRIKKANALRMDWKEFLPKSGKIYIISNPPFLGYSVRDKEQKEDIARLFTDEKGKPHTFCGKMDYVSGWYYKASELLDDTRIKAAFVSTNSITQGEQVTYLFKTLYEKFGIAIDFAHEGFVWDSEATEKAHVHIVVIGIVGKNGPARLRRLYTSKGLKLAENINFYLVPGRNVFAEPTTKPLSPNARKLITGNMPADGGHLIINEEDYEDFITREPKAAKYIKRYMMGKDFINDIVRYCLWLVGASPQEIRDMPLVYERVKAVKELRLKSSQKKLADTSYLFRETRNPEHYLAIPNTSSEKRYYVPMGWLDDSVIPGNEIRVLPDATLYEFGILTSRVHMGWMRRVCGRLKSDYRYSKNIVYNTFAWPEPSPKQRAKIEACAQKILDARSLYPDNSFASLYDDLLMPIELRKAHRENDAAVCRAYGWPEDIEEEEIVSRLFDLYDKLKENHA